MTTKAAIDHYSSIGDLSRRLQEQAISPVDVVNTSLARIKTLNPTLNAFITVMSDEASAQAEVAEAEVKAGAWRGPLHGIPVGIKDFYDTAGIRTTAGSGHFKDRVPKQDAVGVEKLNKAGAVVIGKTNMHELGMGTTGLDSHFGPIHNPWNSEYIPGGSSAGSAAAVASGMCYAAFDTDAIGSCRLPAACCGVVGFKGTYGLVSPKGILEGEAPPDETILWLSHPGITARRVADAAIVLDALAERHAQAGANDFSRELATPKRLRIGVVNNFEADRQVTAAFERAAARFRTLGHPMTEAAAPFVDFSRGIRNIEQDRKAISEHAFSEVDVLVLPTTTTTVPRIEHARNNPQALSPQLTLFANYYGLPAISVPSGFDSDGLPLGVQIVGKPWDDGAVLWLARQYESATEVFKEHPTI